MLVPRERAVLFFAYSSIASGVALAARAGTFPPASAFAFLTTLWLGFVLAISFMEAWIKFRAPFLPRHYGLDVGRTVFSALQSVECGLCLGLWLVSWLAPAAVNVPAPFSTLITTTALLLLQVAWFYPRLELRGEYVIYAAIKKLPEGSLTSTQRKVLHEVANNVHAHAEPPLIYHIVYVLTETVQVFLLARFALLCLTA